MGTLITWLGGAVALATMSVWASSQSGNSAVPVAAVALACGIAVAICCTRPDRRAMATWLAISGVGVAAVHGMLVFDGLPLTDGWRASGRGLARGLREVTVVGASMPGSVCRVRVDDGAGTTILLSVPSGVCPLSQGQILLVPWASAVVAGEPELPGELDPGAHARTKGAELAVEVDDVFVSGPPRSSYWEWVARRRHRAWERSRGDHRDSLVVASVLGIRSALSPAARQRLRGAGLGHVIAVSGMHVAIAAWLARAPLLRLGWLVGGVWPGVLATGVLVVGFVGLSGASAPAVRAGGMLALVAMGAGWGRPAHGVMALVAVTTCMLAWRPAWVLDPGFQLSICAMAALVRSPRDASVLELSWRVTWAIMPVCLAYSWGAPLWGVLANVIAVPVFAVWVLPLGLLGWLVEPVAGSVAVVPARWGAGVLLEVADLASALPPAPILGVTGFAVMTIAVRAMMDSRAHPKLGRILPPWPTCVGWIAVVWFVSDARVEGDADYVVGGRRSHGRIEVRDGRACVAGLTLPPHRARRLLIAIGATSSAVSMTGTPRPDELELARVLSPGGNEFVGVCRADLDRKERRALRSCLRRGGRRRTAVRTTTVPSGRRWQCWYRGRWQPLVL